MTDLALAEALEEIKRLRAQNEHLLKFVFQKCPQCGIVLAPDPAEQWLGGGSC